jgi:hypothetical protein
VRLRGVDVDAAEHLRFVRRDDGVRERTPQLELLLVPAEIDEILRDGRDERWLWRAVGADPIADGIEVLHDVVDRQHPQAEAFVLEPGRDRKVVWDELGHESGG